MNADRHSLLVTSKLNEHILNQCGTYSYDITCDQLNLKASLSKENRERYKEDADQLRRKLPPSLITAMTLAMEKGASSWLTVLPLAEHGFALHKSAFHDALALRYCWSPPNLPSKCECDHAFTVDHALSCAKGGFPSIRHNEIRNITAMLLTEACNDVCVEPDLQPAAPNQLHGSSANIQDGARLDIAANGVWGRGLEITYFDVRVFNPIAPSNWNLPPSTAYRKHEREKKRAYEQRVREVEHSSFTPLVLSAAGGMGTEATIFYKRLASLLAEK